MPLLFSPMFCRLFKKNWLLFIVFKKLFLQQINQAQINLLINQLKRVQFLKSEIFLLHLFSWLYFRIIFNFLDIFYTICHDGAVNEHLFYDCFIEILKLKAVFSQFQATFFSPHVTSMAEKSVAVPLNSLLHPGCTWQAGCRRVIVIGPLAPRLDSQC